MRIAGLWLALLLMLIIFGLVVVTVMLLDSGVLWPLYIIIPFVLGILIVVTDSAFNSDNKTKEGKI